jgi:hypothetical protein
VAWERRGASKQSYYYRSRRWPDGRVVKVYVGLGDRAVAMAAAVALARAERAADRQAVNEEESQLACPDALTHELTEVAQLLLEAALIAAGLHRQNYGPWRRRRGGQRERTR